MSKSVDLREAAIKYNLEGHTISETSKVFGVSKSSIDRWKKKYKETGDLSDKPLSRGFKKINPLELKEYVIEYPDSTQEEMANKFGCTNQAISKALKRNNITRKKNKFYIKNKIKEK